MGKKNRKSRPYDDDDLLMGSSPSTSSSDQQAVNTSTANKQKRPVNIDLLILEQQMSDLMRNYPGRPDDWLYRTIEKNMKLPKHSLKNSLEPHILDQMRRRVEETIYAEEDEAESLQLDEGGGTMKEKDERMSASDEAKLRAEARMAGIDPDEAVEAANDTLATEEHLGTDEHSVCDTVTIINQSLEEEDLQSLQSNATFAVSCLIALQPYTMGPSSNDGTFFTRIFLLLRQYACIIACHLLSTIFGKQARQRASLIWQKVHLPKMEAELIAKRKEEDLQMLHQNSHLWSIEKECWIEKDQVFSPPLDGEEYPLPPTIRWNSARKQWERWSKNLTTRTKKQTAGSSLTKGTFFPAREGDGWATSPDEAEIDSKQLTTQHILFFACLPNNAGTLDVVDVTSWASASLLPKEAARALDAVDSGKTLFSFDLPAANKKAGGKGKQKKKNRGAEPKHANSEDDWIAMKGYGATAQVSQRYLDRMQ